jgi:hypothetical protein
MENEFAPILCSRLVLAATATGTVVYPSSALSKRLHPAISPTIKCEAGPVQLITVIAKKANWDRHWPSKSFFLRAVFNAIADLYQDCEAFQASANHTPLPPSKQAAESRMNDIVEFCKRADNPTEKEVMHTLRDMFLALSVFLS